MSEAFSERLATGQEAIHPDHLNVVRVLVDGETALDKHLIVASDWVNPILVKETRQALKSRQFSWTFLLLIVLVVGWSFMAILSMIPTIYYASDGSGLLLGYLFILIVPSTIIIPQATFRSMASELDDGTFETLSLSLLTPSQIILGKLSVALLQLMIYFSILTPCIALTYLLRGVTLEMIAMLLAMIAMVSVALSVIAITLASLSQSRFLQIVLSVVLVGVQAISAVTLGVSLTGVLSTGTRGWAGWTVLSVALLGFLMYGWLLIRCSASAIGLVSDNRSTPIRVPLLVAGLLLAILSTFFVLLNVESGMNFMVRNGLAIIVNFVAAHWIIAGMLMMGEQGVIPARARRTLPHTLLGRMFLTWFNPGAGPGYVFVLLSFLGPMLAMAIAPMFLSPSVFYDYDFDLILYILTVFAYMALYLGLTRLILMFLFKKLATGRLLVSAVLTIVLVLGSIVGTSSLSLWANNYQRMEYDWYCFSNPFWTLGEIFPSSQGTFWRSSEVVVGVFTVWVVAALVLVVNLLLAAKDVVILRIEAPDRVQAERDRSSLGAAAFSELE